MPPSPPEPPQDEGDAIDPATGCFWGIVLGALMLAMIAGLIWLLAR